MVLFNHHRPIRKQSEESHTSCSPSSPNSAYKDFSWNTIREFGVFDQEPPFLLAWPCSKPFSASNVDPSVCLVSLRLGDMNLPWVTESRMIQENLFFSLLRYSEITNGKEPIAFVHYILQKNLTICLLPQFCECARKEHNRQQFNFSYRRTQTKPNRKM